MTFYAVPDYCLDPLECRACCVDAEMCSHSHCHDHAEHRWQAWTIYPECGYCETEMFDWLRENTDYFELQIQYGRAA